MCNDWSLILPDSRDEDILGRMRGLDSVDAVESGRGARENPTNQNNFTSYGSWRIALQALGPHGLEEAACGERSIRSGLNASSAEGKQFVSHSCAL